MELNNGATYSQTLRTLRSIVGPNARIKRQAGGFVVGLQQGNAFLALGEGNTYQAAFMHAFREGLIDALALRNAQIQKQMDEQAKPENLVDSINPNSIPTNSADQNPILETVSSAPSEQTQPHNADAQSHNTLTLTP